MFKFLKKVIGFEHKPKPAKESGWKVTPIIAKPAPVKKAEALTPKGIAFWCRVRKRRRIEQIGNESRYSQRSMI